MNDITRARLRTPRAVLAAERRTMIEAFGRAGYARYARAAAARPALPTDPARLGALAPRSNARLAAALERVSLDNDLLARSTG